MYYTKKTKFFLNRWAFVLWMMILPTTFLFAQITVSNISGTVKDKNGDPISGAEITATHTATGTAYKTVSGASGSFYIANINPGGPYRVVTNVNGEELVVNIPYINVGEEAVAALSPNMQKQHVPDSGNATQKVNNLKEIVITSNTSSIAKSGPATAFDNKQINTISSIKRSVTDYMNLNAFVGNNYNFAGRDGRYNNFTVDGASMNNSFGLTTGLAGGGNVQPISLDAVDQINVMVSPFDIRQSNFTGGTMNLVTKSGTNNMHGSAYVFYRNQDFNGSKVDGIKITLNKSTYVNYGVNVGGPILKNKLFYFVSFEGELTKTPLSTLVPDNGTNTGGSNVNKVTTSFLDQVSSYLKTQYGYNTGGYDFNTPNAPQNYKALARIDWNINNKNKLMLRYNFVLGNTNALPSSSTVFPIGRPSTGRIASTSSGFAYWNTTYGLQNTVQSIVLDWKSIINNRLSNQVLATYAIDNQIRTIPGGQVFPMVDIMDPANVANTYVSFGNEQFSPRNALKSKTFSIQDNFTAVLNRHTIVSGIGFDYLSYTNQFMAASNGYYRYASWDAFVSRANPLYYAQTYVYPGSDSRVTADFGEPYIYVQDEWKITDYFKVMGAVRMDIPLYFSNLLSNPAFDTYLKTASPFRIPGANPSDAGTTVSKFNINKWPSSTPLFSPRISFNYDVLKNKSLIVRGGVGIFTGRIPFVWMLGVPSNSGTVQNTIVVANPRMAFSPNALQPGDVITDANGKTYSLTTQKSIPTTPAVFDPNFKMPQILRVNLGIDYLFAKDYTVTAEVLYTKDINQVLVYDVNQRPTSNTFYDGRASWWDPTKILVTKTPYINSGTVTNALYVTNTSKGGGVSVMAGISKKFSFAPGAEKKNWTMGVNYVYTDYLELTLNGGSQISSVLASTTSKNGDNYLALSPSSYAVPHKVSGYINYSIDYAGSIDKPLFGSSITLSYTGSPQNRFSYVYSGDFNGDGLNNNDLLYVPQLNAGAAKKIGTNQYGGSDIIFQDQTGYTAQEQYNDFVQYVNNDQYLKKQQGKTTTRNAGIMPWFNQLNLRYLQNFYFYAGKSNTKYTVQLSYEIVNVLNLLNSSWGNFYYPNAGDGFNSVPLRAVAYSNGQPIFNFTKALGKYGYSGSSTKYIDKTIVPSATIASLWQMNLGMRFIF